MKLLLCVLVAGLVTLLSGCGDLLVKQPVPETHTKVVAPEDTLLLDCDVVAPPDREEYHLADPMKREELLVEAFRKQTLNLFTCNKRWKALRAWKEHQLSIYEKD